MRRSPSRARTLAAVLALAFAVSLSGCTYSARSEKPVAPKLRPPSIAKAGVLRVAVDPTYPPFASKDTTGYAGLDVDVACALASRLGLRAEFVEVPLAELPAALRERRADIALGGLPMTDAALSEVSVATSYLSDGPVLFSKDASAAAEGPDGLRIAVQEESHAYWLLRARMGEDELLVTPSLRAALDALASGKVDAAGGDAVVGGYILREYDSLQLVHQLSDATPLAVMVAKDADVVESEVRDAMDVLAAGGVLDAIRGKWLGDLPPLALAASPADEVQLDATVTPAVDTPVVPAP